MAEIELLTQVNFEIAMDFLEIMEDRDIGEENTGVNVGSDKNPGFNTRSNYSQLHQGKEKRGDQEVD